MLNDPDVLLAGNAARALWLSLLLWSAQAGTAGVVPADPRRVATFARLDGGVLEVADALASLVAHGLLVDGPKDGTYAIGAWAETQADLGGSTTRSASTSAAKFKSAHEAGKHSGGQRKGCALCDAGRPGLAVVPEPPRPEGGSPDGGSAEGLPLGGGRELVAEFRATFAGVLEACPTRLDGYRVLLDEARTLGAEHAGLSPRLGSALAHEVLADALGHYLGIGPDVLPRAFRGANALSEDDGVYWWILAAQDAAGRDITPGGEIAYVQAVAASKRSAWLAGAVA
jgi:hypothetical protein